jgi:hypothetical protein
LGNQNLARENELFTPFSVSSLPINGYFGQCFNWRSQVKFGIETNVYQGFCLIYVTKLYNVSHFAGIPAEPLCGTTALNPLAGFLVAASSGASAVATVSGSLLHNKEATKTIEKLKRLQLVLKSDETINWACLWGLGGFSLFCEAIHEATKGNLTDFEIIRKNKLNALTVAAKFVAHSKGIELNTLVTQLAEIKNGKRSQLEEDIVRVAKTVLQQPVIESSVKPPQSIIDAPVAEAISEPTVGVTSNNYQNPIGLSFPDQMNQNAWDILQGLVTDAGKSKLPGCVILAAPGAGKTTFLGTAWGRLKQAYGSHFNSLAIIVKHDDLEAFRGVSDNCLVVEDSPREAAVAILRFIESSKRKDNNIRRLFLDDFLTMNEVFKAALGGLLINPRTFEIVLTRKEDYDAQPLLPTLNTALNKLWLVGRQNNAALWVSSHSSNVDALPFVGSRESRDIGSTIFLAHSNKRYFIEQAINNANLIPDNTKRQVLKASLELIETNIEEPLVLANFNNWTLGIVSSEVYDEYQEFRKEWETTEPVLKPGEKLSDVIKSLEASLEASNETDKEDAIESKDKEEIKEVEVEPKLSDIAQRLLSFFDNAKNKEPKSLADIKKKDELREYGDAKVAMALYELVVTRQVIFDGKDRWSKVGW